MSAEYGPGCAWPILCQRMWLSQHIRGSTTAQAGGVVTSEVESAPTGSMPPAPGTRDATRVSNRTFVFNDLIRPFNTPFQVAARIQPLRHAPQVTRGLVTELGCESIISLRHSGLLQSSHSVQAIVPFNTAVPTLVSSNDTLLSP